MNSERTPNPGWYDDAKQPGQQRWWNGAEWTPTTRPKPPPPPRPVQHPPATRDNGFPLIALVTQLLLGLAGLASAAMIIGDVISIRFAHHVIDDPLGVDLAEADLVDSWNLATSISQFGITLLCGVTFIAWLYQAHNGWLPHPESRRHRSVWAITGWFVPILSAFRPFQMMTDVRRGIEGGAARAGALQGWWWAVFLFTAITSIPWSPLSDRLGGNPRRVRLRPQEGRVGRCRLLLRRHRRRGAGDLARTPPHRRNSPSGR